MTYVLLIINAYSQFMLGLYFYFFEVRIKAQIPGGGGAHGNHIISSEAHKARGCIDENCYIQAVSSDWSRIFYMDQWWQKEN